MNFTSVEYLGFLALVAIVYWPTPTKYRPVVLLVSSYFFYGVRDWRFVPLLAGTTAATWLLANAIDKAEGTRRKYLMIFTVAMSFSVLVAFKLFARVSSSGLSGGGFSQITSDVIVPVGLSFYTFQVVSYVVDVYRRDLDPEPSPVAYATYVAFFPHLLAGPVVRAGRLLPQIHATTVRPDRVRLAEGFDLLLLGIFKKVAVADPLLRLVAVSFGTSFGAEAKTSTVQMLLVFVAGLIGAFMDVSGYIDIARGSAKLLGIDMPANFAQPLTRSRNVTEFWRRWQMTIMGWFRDYVYLPIRGRSRTDRREALGLAAVFLSTSIWHGFSVGWLVWGAITVSLLLIEQRYRRYRTAVRKRTGGRKDRLPKWARAVVGPMYIFTALLVSAPFAAANSISEAFDFYRRIFGGGWGGAEFSVVFFALYGLVVLWLTDQYDRYKSRVESTPDPITVRRAISYGCMIIAILVFSGGANQDFVYFHF